MKAEGGRMKKSKAFDVDSSFILYPSSLRFLVRLAGGGGLLRLFAAARLVRPAGRRCARVLFVVFDRQSHLSLLGRKLLFALFRRDGHVALYVALIALAVFPVDGAVQQDPLDRKS